MISTRHRPFLCLTVVCYISFITPVIFVLQQPLQVFTVHGPWIYGNYMQLLPNNCFIITFPVQILEALLNSWTRPNKHIYIYSFLYLYSWLCMYVYIYIYIYHLHIPSHTNGGCYTHNTPWPRLAKSQVLNFGTATRLSKENRSVGKVSKEASATKFSTSRYKAY